MALFWKSEKEKRHEQYIKIVTCAFFMTLFILVFKYIPMYIWGSDIRFDASLHLAFTFFILYIFWFFIDQSPELHFPFFLIAILVLFIISIQRLLVFAHSDIGLLLGLSISIFSIAVAERRELRGKVQF